MYEELQERGLIAQVTDEKEIREMDKWDDTRINEKKEILAYSLTEIVHGKEEADKAKIADMHFLMAVVMTAICQQHSLKLRKYQRMAFQLLKGIVFLMVLN